MGKVAVELERSVAHRALTGTPGSLSSRVLCLGDGWSARDVLCTSGPQDRPFEEQHSQVSIALVIAGTFQYSSGQRRELMTPGSLMLGNAGQYYECGHEHSAGDRCLSFQYESDYFEELSADAGAHGRDFHLLRLPPLPTLAPFVARACAGVTGADVSWEELTLEIARALMQAISGVSGARSNATSAALARVTRVVRMIDRDASADLRLGTLAQESGLSIYHFLRTFELLTGMTPHQYVLRSRLREAAARLLTEPSKIVDIALDCGFADLSNFNRAFRQEFGANPRSYRKQHGMRR